MDKKMKRTKLLQLSLFLLLSMTLFCNVSESANGTVVTVDGIAGSESINHWYVPPTATTYLYDEITPEWRILFKDKIGDVQAFYWGGNPYTQTMPAVTSLYNILKPISDYNLKNNTPLVIISHSWGTVLSYIVLHEHPDIVVDKLITMGSPLDNLTPGIQTVTYPALVLYGIFNVHSLPNIKIWNNYWALCDPVSDTISAATENSYFRSFPSVSCGNDYCHCAYYKDISAWDYILSDAYETPTPTPSSTSKIPDTGQTQCYDVVGHVITCPSPGQALYGQDANYSINPMSYTKLDDSGNTLSDSAASWSMVKDNVTGLIWEMKTNKDGVKNYNNPHDADNTYTWYDSNPATNGGNVGTYKNGTNTENFIKALNDAHYGGYSDWRMPTIKELAYIFNYSISSGPTIDTGYFPNTAASWYWSSTPSANSTSFAWSAFFSDGSNHDLRKDYSDSILARAVRGGQTRSAYTDNSNGTVTDTSTGLMWQKASSSGKTWEQALAYCEGLSLGGYTD